MAYQFDDFQKFGKAQLEAVTTSSSSLAKEWRTIATESSEFSKKLSENGSVFLGKLLGAKSFETAVHVQAEYTKSLFDGFFEYMKKTGELYSNIAKETFKPVETAIGKVQAFKD